MKNLAKAIILQILIPTVFFSCDVIDEDNRTLPMDFGDLDVSKTVLIEDLTGVYCNNCPSAAAAARTIQEALPGKVVVVSVHTGPFATPMPNTQDFRTEAGDAYQKRFYPANNSYPAGMISRTIFDGNIVSTDYSKWNAYTLERLRNQIFPLVLKLTLVPSFDPQGENGSVTSTIDALSPVTAAIKWQLWLVESHIISPQLSKTGIIQDYEHNHVLRDAVNGVWGETVEIKQGEHKVYKHAYPFKNKNWKPENMAVVGFIYDANTMQVLYVTEVPLMNNLIHN
jgi:hypothetical protein